MSSKLTNGLTRNPPAPPPNTPTHPPHSLFFREAHAGLLHMLRVVLSRSGIALLLAPRRGDTFDSFVSLANATARELHIEVSVPFGVALPFLWCR